MTLYLLDTDICSYIMKRSNDKVLTNLRKTLLADVAVSVITEAELLFGIKISKSKNNEETYRDFIRHVNVLDWTRDAAADYARLRAELHKTGQMIGANDLLIAAHALSISATLVSNNEREFKRIKGLKLKNWTK